MANLDDFSDAARTAVQSAFTEANRLDQTAVGTGHLLFGLMDAENNGAIRLLAKLGVSFPNLRQVVEHAAGEGPDPVDGAPKLTRTSEIVLNLAVMEGRRLSQRPAGTAHIVLGMLGKGEGVAAGALIMFGVNHERARTLVRTGLYSDGVDDRPVDRPGPVAGQHPLDMDGVLIDEDFSATWALLSDQSRHVVGHARREALRLDHAYIGTEHILLGLAREGDCFAAMVLAANNVGLPKIRRSVEHVIGRGVPGTLTQNGLTPGAKLVFQLALEEARELSNDTVGTGDVLLGLIRDKESIANALLASLGVNRDNVRDRLLGSTQESTASTWGVPIGTMQFVLGSPELSEAALASLIAEFAGVLSLDRFTESARRAIVSAVRRAEFPFRRQIQPEDLLIEVCIVPGGFLQAVMGMRSNLMDPEMGLIARCKLGGLATEMTSIVPVSDGKSPALSERSWTLIRYAQSIARSNGQSHVGTSHLLEALFEEPNGTFPAALRLMEIPTATFRAVAANAEKRALERSRDLVWKRRTAGAMNTAGSLNDVRRTVCTSEALLALEQATRACRRSQRTVLGTEHLLLGLLESENGLAVELLIDAGVVTEQLRARVKLIVPDRSAGDTIDGVEPALSTAAMRALGFAVARVRQAPAGAISTGSMLLGLLESGGVAAGLLEVMGININDLAKETIAAIGSARDTELPLSD